MVFEAGHWAVTTTDDAYANRDGANFDPVYADPHEPVWCVYDERSDDEPAAQGMTRFWADKVATALHLMDVVAPVLGALESEPMPAPPRGIVALGEYLGIQSKGYWVTCCVACDGDHPMPMPFGSLEERENWVSAHTRGTGHNHYIMVDPVRDQDSDQLPLGFAQAGEVSFGEIMSGPGVTGLAIHGPEPEINVVVTGRVSRLGDDGRPTGPSYEIKPNPGWRPDH